MKVKDIGVKSIIETTSAGSIASVASSLFTPTTDGRPALIRRTKKKKNKDPSIYSEGFSSDAQRRAAFANGYKSKKKKVKEDSSASSVIRDWIERNNASREGDQILYALVKHLEKSDPTMHEKVTEFIKGSEGMDEGSTKPEYHNTQVKGSDATPKAKPGRTNHPFRGKLVGEGDMEADREAGIKWVDDPDWKRLHDMDDEMIMDYINHKEVAERKLSGSEKKNREHNVKKLKKHKKNFTDRYGKDGESVMYAVATKSAKKGKKYK